MTIGLACSGRGLDPSHSQASTGRIETRLQKLKPQRPQDLWSDEVWAAHVERVATELRPDALRPAKEGWPGHPAYVPLDPSLLERVTFVSLPVSDLKTLLRTWQPEFIPGQPYGKCAFVMWPRDSSCCSLVLVLEWEIDDRLVPVVTAESLEKRCGEGGISCGYL